MGAAKNAGPAASGPGLANAAGAGGLRCDFCGGAAGSLRRIALAPGYDRLQTPHRELYACPACSARKEAGLPGGRSEASQPVAK
ncbi:MAG: hypothetical protein OXU53_06180 [Deltaproteobacteria bacterium]|nr:hypothetical protein [Deltaproteobacteria bacterium]